MENIPKRFKKKKRKEKIEIQGELNLNTCTE